MSFNKFLKAIAQFTSAMDSIADKRVAAMISML